jgi:hypothetical protein
MWTLFKEIMRNENDPPITNKPQRERHTMPHTHSAEPKKKSPFGYGETITEAFAFSPGKALSTYLGQGKLIAVGHDIQSLMEENKKADFTFATTQHEQAFVSRGLAEYCTRSGDSATCDTNTTKKSWR